MNITKLAWSNVWRNTRRSVVTMSAMTVALAALLVFTSLQRGLTENLERSVVEMETGDLQIFAAGYRDKASMFLRIEDPATLVKTLRVAGFKASARVKASGLAAGDKTSAGAMLIGIDPAADREVSRVFEQVKAGVWVDPSDAKGVVIGGKLAKTLGLDVGGEILLLGSASDGSMANELYQVRGILHGTNEGVDRAGVFMNAQTLLDLMVLQGGSHQVLVRRPSFMSLADARASAVAIAPGLDVQTWEMLLPTVAQMLENQKASKVLLSLIIFTAVGIVILNAMMMAVFERIRELGVLKAIGMQPRTVFALVMVEGFFQMLVAMCAGCVLAIPFLYVLVTQGVDVAAMAGVHVQGVAFGSRWMAEIDRNTLLTPMIVLACVSFLAALFPALRAARLQPIDAIHHQ